MRPDRPAGGMALAFVVLLLASEAALTLPDADATDAAVASFYAGHRLIVILLQIVGFVAAGLLARFAGRLYPASRLVARIGTLTAVLALLPGIAVIVIAVVADPSTPAAAGRWNQIEARADDLLLVGILLFALAVLARLGQQRTGLGIVALLTAGAVLGRLVVEALGMPLGALESIAPICFLVLVAWLGVLAFRGSLGSLASSPAPA